MLVRINRTSQAEFQYPIDPPLGEPQGHESVVDDGGWKNSVPATVSAAPRPAVSHSMENCAKVNSLLGMVRVACKQLC
jgi:hypothetical protein